MVSKLNKYHADLERLICLGEDVEQQLSKAQDKGGTDLVAGFLEVGAQVNLKSRSFGESYQAWYTETYRVIQQIIPERLAEFKLLYQSDRMLSDLNEENYCIKDFLTGREAPYTPSVGKDFNEFYVIHKKIQIQLGILKAAQSCFNSSLHNITHLVQADLFDSEMEAAKDLLESGFVRCAGAMGGVILESHLSQVCINHEIKITTKRPHIRDYSKALKEANVIEIATFREIEWVADIRNLCDHKKEPEPNNKDVGEMLVKVDKFCHDLF